MEFVSKEAQFKTLHLIPIDLLKTIVKEAYFYESHYDLSFDHQELYDLSKMTSCSLSFKEFSSACKALQGLVSWLLNKNPSNSGKFTFHNILATHSSMEEDEINELEADYDDLLKDYPGKQMLKSGLQLIDLDWRAGITVATDSSVNINIPYIELQLSFVNPQTGLKSSSSLTLDYQSFVAFSRDVRKIYGLLETYN